MVMISHGFSTGALFLLIGMIYERRHTRLIEDYGGIARVVPVFSLILTVVALSLHRPARAQRLRRRVPRAARQLRGLSRGPPGIATTGVIFAAAYLLWALQRIIFNRLDNRENEHLHRSHPAGARGACCRSSSGIVWLGLYPGPVLRRMEPATRRFVEAVQPGAGADDRAARRRRRGAGSRR